MSKRILFLLLFIPLLSVAQHNSNYPAEVETVLRKSGKNRVELEKAIAWCKKTGDPLKVKAIYFLISNMDIHYSENYYWADKNGNKVAFDELLYPDFKSALEAFAPIKLNTPGIHAVPEILWDINTIKGEYLINNIEEAFKAWKQCWAKNIPFNDFCEYVLPYRVCSEPLQSWRSVFNKKFSWINEKAKTNSPEQTLSYVYTDERNWFTDTWGKEDRNEPLPHLGAMQLLQRKNGKCEDIADLEVFTLRSQGIPATLNVIPYWATATDSHFVNTAFDGQMHPIQFDVTRTPPVDNKLAREPSKVIRVTYSKQANTLANIEPTKDIPNGFMRSLNYIDITDQYWETTTISCPLFPHQLKSKIAYACVFNGLKWKPTWWGKVTNDRAIFTSMSKGAVYLPIYYTNGKVTPAGYPIVEGYQHELVLEPDTIHRHLVTIENQEKYLFLKSGKKYKLLYWDNTWKPLGTKTAPIAATALLFENVPKNALLLLIAEDSKGLERPFIITDDGKRVSW